MLFHSPCISLGDKPKARLQSLGLDVVRQPLRPVRELLTIPLLNPVMLAVLSTVVTIIKLNIIGKAQSFSEIVREDAHPGMSRHGDREIEQVLILIVALHPC